MMAAARVLSDRLSVVFSFYFSVCSLGMLAEKKKESRRRRRNFQSTQIFSPLFFSGFDGIVTKAKQPLMQTATSSAEVAKKKEPRLKGVCGLPLISPTAVWKGQKQLSGYSDPSTLYR